MRRHVSTAEVSRRTKLVNTYDYYPTPYWATRALCDKLLLEGKSFIYEQPQKPPPIVLSRIESPFCVSDHTVWDPCCGGGHMVEVLREYFREAHGSDIAPHGEYERLDFMEVKRKERRYDWIITNPPFTSMEKTLRQAWRYARWGVALLGRIQFLETIGRYRRVFSLHPPGLVLVFSSRLAFAEGRLPTDEDVGAACFAWYVWWKKQPYESWVGNTQLGWIPPEAIIHNHPPATLVDRLGEEITGLPLK